MLKTRDKAAIFCRFFFAKTLAALALAGFFNGWQISKYRYNKNGVLVKITAKIGGAVEPSH